MDGCQLQEEAKMKVVKISTVLKQVPGEDHLGIHLMGTDQSLSELIPWEQAGHQKLT